VAGCGGRPTWLTYRWGERLGGGRWGLGDDCWNRFLVGWVGCIGLSYGCAAGWLGSFCAPTVTAAPAPLMPPPFTCLPPACSGRDKLTNVTTTTDTPTPVLQVTMHSIPVRGWAGGQGGCRGVGMLVVGCWVAGCGLLQDMSVVSCRLKVLPTLC